MSLISESLDLRSTNGNFAGGAVISEMTDDPPTAPVDFRYETHDYVNPFK